MNELNPSEKLADILTILLVEDEQADAVLIKRALNKGGILNPIRRACDGREALDYLFGLGDFADREAHPMPGLVLLDLKLPKVSGLEVLQQFKATEAGRRTPVVVLTSSAESIDVNRAYDLGANSYLVKPVTFSAFSEVATAIRLYWVLLNHFPDCEGR